MRLGHLATTLLTSALAVSSLSAQNRPTDLSRQSAALSRRSTERAQAVGAKAEGATADWPQWRGPNRDGVIPSFTAPNPWPEKLTRKWKVDVGLGYATPV